MTFDDKLGMQIAFEEAKKGMLRIAEIPKLSKNGHTAGEWGCMPHLG